MVILLALVFWTACERVTIPPDNTRTGYDYFPLETGLYRVYDVSRINYNFATENDTLHYQRKEQVNAAFLNQEGDSTFVLHILSRKGPDTSWKLDSIKHIRKTSRQLIESSNNKALVQLVFPVAEGKSWDSNLLSSAAADSFRMVAVHRPYVLSDSVFEETVTVVQQNIADTIVRQDIRRAVFALRTGPVHRLSKVLNYCATTDCIGKGIINSGHIEEMKLIESGKE